MYDDNIVEIIMTIGLDRNLVFTQRAVCQLLKSEKWSDNALTTKMTKQ